jgi:hypothetical protein
LYLFFGAFPQIFSNNHNFNLWQVGLTFSGLVIGIIGSAALDPLWRKNFKRLVDEKERRDEENGVIEPEFRLPQAILGSILVPIGMFWFAWTTYKSMDWIVPIIRSVWFGMG